MTKEDLNRQLFRIEQDAKMRKNAVLNQYARENARYTYGQIVRTADGVIFQIDAISGDYVQNVPYICYYGKRLTEKLENRKDGARWSEYELRILGCVVL